MDDRTTMIERDQFLARLDSLCAEFRHFCRDMRPETKLDDATADLAGIFAAFKLDGNEADAAAVH